ncbi:HNH endonuclease [Galactobacter caseinivorans]|uniref:HNH endonuclease n=2 Tax=Galactobacter caseinivorans TaxID=2676123 RepID=A0A496PG36_9MICC|nr:HNH endonuclease [Galactobacter caseinivorans]
MDPERAVPDRVALDSALATTRAVLAPGAVAWEHLSDEELAGWLGTIADLSRAVVGLQVEMAAALLARSSGPSGMVDSSGRPARDPFESFDMRMGFRTPKGQLMQLFGLRAFQAETLLKLASATRALAADAEHPARPAARPALAAALQRGELSSEQAWVVHQELPEEEPTEAPTGILAHSEAALVAQATGGRVDLTQRAPGEPEPVYDRDVWGGRRLEVHHLRDQAKDWAVAMRPERVEPDYATQVRARSLRLSHAKGGGYDISGFAPETEGAALLSLLDAYTSPRRRPGGPESPDDVQTAPGAPVGPAAQDEIRSREQISFDVLHMIFDHHARGVDSPTNHGAAPTLVITLSAEALARHQAAEPAPLVTGATGPVGPAGPAGPQWADALSALDDRFARVSRSNRVIPVGEALTLLCNDNVQYLVTGDGGEPLELGRKRRHFSPHQRKALIVRDRHCRAPGCTAPPDWCEAHHVVPWAEGGPTDLDHGILLCNFHHHEVHRGHLLVEPVPVPSGPRGGPPRTPWRVISTHTADYAPLSFAA